MKVLVAMGLLFSIPDIVGSIRELIGVKGSPFKFGPGAFFGGVTAGFAGGVGLVSQFSSVNTALFGHQAFQKGLVGRYFNKGKKTAQTDDLERPAGGQPHNWGPPIESTKH